VPARSFLAPRVVSGALLAAAIATAWAGARGAAAPPHDAGTTAAVAPTPRPLAPVTEIDRSAVLEPADLADLLRHAPGVRVVRHGLHAFALDVRGLEGVTERRLLVLVDGRDASVPLAGTPPWAAVAFAGEELERLELARGPGSARYGGGAYGGVLALVTRSPRAPRSDVRLAAGERDSAHAWTGWAGEVAGATYLAVNAGFERSRGFARSRVDASEYAGLPRERLPLDGGRERVGGFDLRLERDFAANASLRLAAGTAAIAGVLTRSELDRQQVTDADAPWLRFDLTTPSRRLRGSWTGYRSRAQRALGLGRELSLDADRYAIELEGERAANAHGRLTGGLVVQGELADSRDARGRETWLARPLRDSLQGAWGSADFDLGRRARMTVGGRLDRAASNGSPRGADLQVSPRLGFAYAFGDAHTLRIHAGRGFVRPSAEQRSVEVPLREPLDLSPLQDAYGLDLGFDGVPVVALGNPLLRPESVSSVEAGYSGRLGPRVHLDFDAHRSRHRDLVSGLLPGVAAAYPPYSVPAGVPPELASLFLQTLDRFLDPGVRAGLASLSDGSPAVVQSFANAGEAVIRGADVGLRVRIARRWESTLAYSLLDFHVERTAPGDVLVANAPDHRLAVTLAYGGPELRVAAAWRGQPEFEWSAGGSRGIVPALSDVEVAMSRRLGKVWELGLRVTNAFDRRRYESFGGDLLGRRALLTVGHSGR
jgi:outer membrane receptor protein involved in Fe transport